MNKKIFIRKLVAILLLVVFMVSALPKALIHDIVAQHKDTISCTHGPVTTDCMHNQGTNCHFDELVVTVPFLYEKCESPLVLYKEYIRSYSSHQNKFTQDLFSSEAGRSPPIC